MGNNGIGGALVVGFAIFLFIVCRAIVLWYWRINESVALLKSIDDKLGKLVSHQESGRQPPA